MRLNNVEYFLFVGTFRHGVEIRSNQIVDELLRGGYNITTAIQCSAIHKVDHKILQEEETKRLETRLNHCMFHIILILSVHLFIQVCFSVEERTGKIGTPVLFDH